MGSWKGINADLIIADPPFGNEFDGIHENYNRKKSNVVEGYVEWPKKYYSLFLDALIETCENNLSEQGQALIMSGWQNSHVIHSEIEKSKLTVVSKLYWVYNFASNCTKKPSHNVYEIFHAVKDPNNYFYNPSCAQAHCRKQMTLYPDQKNLSTIVIKREYRRGMPKYPTMLPLKLVFTLLDHFSREGDLIFDPVAGSGMIGIGAEIYERKFLLGDVNPKALQVYNIYRNYYKKHQNHYLNKTLEAFMK